MSTMPVKEKGDSSNSDNRSSSSSSIKDDMEANRINLFLHAENVRIFTTPQDRCLPVTLVTGFLGSGKTTLLNHMLSNKSNLRIAAAINDFAELNIDENLIRHQGTANRLVELSNGCICCHLLDDLQAAVWKMLQRGGDVDVDAVNYLIIETSGISDPSRIIRTLDAKFGKCFRARLDSVVTVVDADQMLPYCSNNTTTSSRTDDASNADDSCAAPDKKKKSSSSIMMSQAAIAQLECADVVIVNKMDLLQDDPIKNGMAVERLIRSINPHARIHQTRHCQIPLSAILDVQQIPIIISKDSSSGASPITHEQSSVPIYVSATGGALRCTSSLSTKSNATTTMTAASAHLKTDEFVSLSVSVQNGPLSLKKFCQFVTSPMIIDRLARIKGVLWIQSSSSLLHCQLESFRCVVHLSGRGRLGFQLDGKWTSPPVSEMAFIGQKSSNFVASEIETAFANCSSSSLPCDTNNKEKAEEEKNATNGCNEAWNILKQSPEFDLVALDDCINDTNDDNGNSLLLFRLTGSQIYGYTVEEIERDLRIDIDAMNMDLADAVNASVDRPKAFVVYTKARIKSIISSSGSSSNGTDSEERVVLCYPAGMGEPANNWQVLLREARVVLQTHFRNVQVCKCGA